MWLNETKWDFEIRNAGNRFGVPPELIKAIIGAESAFTPNALRREVKIEDASAGLMQVLLNTARGEGYAGPMGDPAKLTGLFDPATNITYGTSYLKRQLDRVGRNVSAAVSAYNGGYRPELGFGALATKPLTLCLARDAQGKCISTRNVKAGEFGNQPYVDKVLGYYQYFQTKSPPAILTVPTPPQGPRPSPLGSAHHVDEPESFHGGRDSGTPARSTWLDCLSLTTLIGGVIRILQWFRQWRRHRK